MADEKAQTYTNHTKFDPLFHFFLAPVAAINLVTAIVSVVRHPTLGAAWIVVLSLAAFVAVFKIRLYSLRVQDRVIRLEERLRLSMLLEEPLRSRARELTESQLIGLRFACDAEVAKLVEAALASGLKGAQIKKQISVWRPDYFRV